MPSYRGIAVKLHTPFSIKGIPETTQKKGVSNSSPDTSVIDESQRRVSVYVPIVPRSNFWLSYSVEDPPTKPKGVFYVFKLFINLQPVVTWCCGEEEEWEGKTVFSLYNSGKENAVGGAGMEKRYFHFGDEVSLTKEVSVEGKERGRFAEVHIFRANVRIRVPREMKIFEELPEGSGVELPNSGLTKRGYRREFYRFGLLDPVDTPYATFRFYYRTAKEIDALSLRMQQVNLEQTPDSTQRESAQVEESDKRWTSSKNVTATKLDRSSYSSISEQYFSYSSCSSTKKRASTNGDGSPLRDWQKDSPQSSPERGRCRTARRETITRSSQGPWVPPMPNAPILPPPVPERRTNNVWHFGPRPILSSLHSSNPLQEQKVNPKRLSIPPSLILRPLLAHGLLDVSPTKTVLEEADEVSKHEPPSAQRGPRAETGGMLRSVMANAVRRRITDPNGSRDG